jgi:membrane protein DedA with SNARE-associated domain
MDSLLGWILSYVLIYKYVAIFIIAFSGAIILPLPVNPMLLAIGAFSSQGYFNVWASLSIAVTGNVLGDMTDYLVAKKYGELIIRKLKLRSVRFFRQLEEELRRDAVGTVFTSRFAGSLSPVVVLLAGFVGVPFFSFFIPDILGDFIEPFVILFIGYALGIYWSSVSGTLNLIAALVATSVVLFVLFRMYRRMSKRYGEQL